LDESGKPIASTDLPKTWLPVYKPTGDEEEDRILSDKCGEGLLFIDELSRTKDDVMSVILPLINEGEFNGHKLGDKWTIMVASNRMEDDKGQNELGTALSNRFLQVQFEPTVENWLEWARKQNYMSPVVLDWLAMPKNERNSGSKYYYWDPNDSNNHDDPTTIMCTPRSWTNALQFLSTFVKTEADIQAGEKYGDLSGYKIFDLPRDIIRMALNMAIPAEAVDAFMSFFEIIDKVGDIRILVEDVWKNGGKRFKLSQKELLDIGLQLSQIVCNYHADKLPTQKEMTNLFNWLASLNSEQMASHCLDNLLNIYASKENTPKSTRDKFFILKEVERSGELTAAELKAFKKSWEPWCKKWGLTWAKLPDYSQAIEILIDKYGETFVNTKIDSHSSVL
jgi:hypothetical protein